MLNAKLRKIFFVTALLLITACSQSKHTPGDVIAKDQMQSILIDIHYAQIKVDIDHLPPDSAKKKIVTYYNHIFKLHHVTAQHFLDSFDYYLQHPEIMDDIYQDVLNDMNNNINAVRANSSKTK